MFTDGLVINEENSVVFGVWVFFINLIIMHKLPPGTSVFLAEAWVALQAIKLALDRGWEKSVIFIGSLSWLHVLKNCLYYFNHLLVKVKNVSLQAQKKAYRSPSSGFLHTRAFRATRKLIGRLKTLRA